MMLSPDQRLSKLIRVPETSVDIAECALVIAQHEYPALDVAAYLQQLDTVANRLKQRLPADAAKPHIISMLNHFLFRELGYSGNRDDFYDPRNSCLNDVIDRRTGIPITLSIVFMEIGRRLGLPLQGISFPGHFLVKCTTDQGVIVLDPFNRGISLSERDLRERMKQAAGSGNDAEAPLSLLLRPATQREILTRLARNLKGIYADRDEAEKLIAITNFILAINPDDAKELRDRGMTYYKLDCFRAALADFEQVLALDSDAADDDAIHELIAELKQKTRLLN
jgi:regulator of sirC expression with transglutaminase-like and TPR domain